MTNEQTDWRALCARLAGVLDSETGHTRPDGTRWSLPVVIHTRDLLAQTEPEVSPWPVPGDAEGLAEVFWGRYEQPEPEGVTDEELLRLACEKLGYEYTPALLNCPVEVTGCLEALPEELVAFARHALIRWGRPTIKPVPVSERPWEREGWCDDRGYCWMRRKYEPKGVTWRLIPPPDRYAAAYFLESLPHHALPLPQPH